MQDKEYVENALRTESNDFDAIRTRMKDVAPLLGTILSQALASAQAVDLLKKYLFYGKAIDAQKLQKLSKAMGSNAAAQALGLSPPSEHVTTTPEMDLTTCQETTIRSLHAAMGLLTESGEVIEAVARELSGLGPIDRTNVKEEAGDLFWYLAILSSAAGFSFGESKERNIEKLRARYGDRFSDQRAKERDLAMERDVLEGSQNSKQSS